MYNNAHFYPNNSTTYGQWKILGSKGGYSGIQLGNSTGYMTIMDSGNHRGLYKEDKGTWLFYANNDCNVGIRTSSIWVTGLNVSGNVYAYAGLLYSNNNGNTVTIGSQNSSWTHIYNSANIPFIFNNTVCTTSGNLGSTSYPWGTARRPP